MLIKNAKGQIAIFVVLIFQVLFILFAMTINIGLVVHDKINFQNSLDLAAYYGAKQQAEVLNAMAHINYQMRQNWKLLAWRYRILGTLAQDDGGTHPEYWCPQNKNRTHPADCTSATLTSNTRAMAQCQNAPYGGNYCDWKYFICISEDSWGRGIALSRANQNLCENLNNDPPSINPLPMIAPHLAVAHIARAGVSSVRNSISQACPTEGALNGLMVHFLMSHFRMDQRDRKSMLREIYKKSLGVGRDLDGQSIFDGAKKVFFHNLSRANKNNVRTKPDYGLEEFNSSTRNFENLFENLNVFPLLQYLDFTGSTGDCNSTLKDHTKATFNHIESNLDNGHTLKAHLRQGQEYLIQLNTIGTGLNEIPNSPIQSLTLGFFKKRNKIIYYGLKGKLDYLSRNQIFSLSLNPDIEFKASSFAKPFGGRFGPQAGQNDPLIPVNHPQAINKIPTQSGNTQLNRFLLQPNYSRWPGDKWGLIDRQLHDKNTASNFLNKISGKDHVYTIEAFFHLFFYGGTADDPLARLPNDPGHKNTFMRMMELMAVYPDVYDISLYSIAGNYMQTYFPRICRLLKGSDCDTNARNELRTPFKAYIRGDFGWPESDHYISQNFRKKRVQLSIAPYFLKRRGTQIDTSAVSHPLGNTVRLFGTSAQQALSQGKIFYPWLAQELPDHLLSSWSPPKTLDYGNYAFPNRFMSCPNKALRGMPVPSSCVEGGRSGYSVKLISCKMVQSFSDKPSNFQEYCP